VHRKSWMTLLTLLIAQCLPLFNIVSDVKWCKVLIWEGAAYKIHSIISANFQKSGGSDAYPDSNVAPPLVGGVVDDEFGAEWSKVECDFSADSAGRAGYDCYSVLKRWRWRWSHADLCGFVLWEWWLILILIILLYYFVDTLSVCFGHKLTK
jgi:hypothetical protein